MLKNIIQRDGGDVVIKFDDRNAQIKYDDGEMTCRLIEGRYPNYNSVIPQSNPNQITIDRGSLLSALRRVQPFANDSSNLIRFHVGNGTLQLDAEDFDFSVTGYTLGRQLLGCCGSENFTWEYGVGYFDDITATNIYGYDVRWISGDEDPAEEYRVDQFMY